jgi:carbamoyl-phosphate synthase large subunit
VTGVGRHSAVRPRRRGSALRRRSVLLELLLAGAICVLGFRFGAAWMQVHEAAWVTAVLHVFGVSAVSGVLPAHLLVFRPGGEVVDAVVTPSCSAVLSLLGLAALTATVLRSRRLHALWGLAVAVVAVVIANDVRLAASTLAGLAWGTDALVLFHDWVGTIWNFAATLGGFLLMVSLTLPEPGRAEQDLSGRHTARRPSSWARPGLGYRVEDADDARRGGRTLTGLVHRHLLPRAVTRRLAARREAGRIDYRLGHLAADQRVERVRALAADGLGAHAATLVAVATYDTDRAVLDTLAEAVAARQWEPVTSERVAALRLWARGWMQSRRLAPSATLPPVPRARGRQVPAVVGPLPLRPATPRSFALPAAGPHPTEDAR